MIMKCFVNDGEAITSMRDCFAEISNGLNSLGKHIDYSEKVKRLLRLLPR